MSEKLSGMNITSKEFGRRFRKALSVPFSLNQVCSTNITEFVSSYATALGCSEKTFFLPLLTCTAACMGTNSYIELSSLWQEPTIIWTHVVTPKSLLRIDVAEHLKQELLNVQNEMWDQNETEDSRNYWKKFIFDIFTIDQLRSILQLSSGHGFGIYNSIRTLHKCMMSPEDTDIMHRLHYGLGLFSDCRVKKSTLTNTRVNLSVISTPSVVQQTLNSAPNFQELFYQCFLTVCAEENHIKFSQLSAVPETEKLREIFTSLIKIHSSGSVVYKFGVEATEKFEQIHDELSDKARQMSRKNIEYKVFQPAVSYLARLSCVLHVLDNVIEAINFKAPLSPWNTEINAATVWYARELLGHIIEQRHALMEQITFDPVVQTPRTPVHLVNRQQSPQMRVQTSIRPQVQTAIRPQVQTSIRSPIRPQRTIQTNQVR